jgi:hypothetical protein
MSSLSINNIPGAMQSAQLGIQRGLSGLNLDAQVVANGLGGGTNGVTGAQRRESPEAPAVRRWETGNGVDASGDIGALTGALVDSLQQKLLVEASARMMSTVDKTLGTLIDVKA